MTAAPFIQRPRVLSITQGIKEMSEAPRVAVPPWLIGATLVFGALSTMGAYVFGAGSKSGQLDTLISNFAAMTLKFETVSSAVMEIKSHSEARDEQFKNLNARIDDLAASQREMNTKIEQLEISRR
jgi:outer membrane murein-binding lipoprotein Lpp